MREFRTRWGWPLGIFGGALALRIVFFTGLQGHDDLIYSRVAYALSEGRWEPGEDLVFWLRLGATLPVALLYKLFGVHFLLLVTPNLAASMLLVGLAWRFGRELYSEAAGRAAAIFTALLPMDVFHATESHSDLPQAALATLGIYLLWSALRQESSRRTLIRAAAAGLAFGAAHLVKESAFLLVLPFLPRVRDRKAWGRLGTAGIAFVAVVAGELLLWGLTSGDPLLRVHAAARTQDLVLAATPETFASRACSFLSMLFNPLGTTFVYTGGLLALAALAFVWALGRDRQASGWIAFWFAGVLLLLAFWPRSISPYRPVMLLHARVLAPIVVPAALLAGRFLTSVRPRWAVAGGTVLALLCLVCSTRLHQDAFRFRQGAEWAYTRLQYSSGERVVTDVHTAGLLRFMARYKPSFDPVAYTAETPPPPPGTLLLDNERWTLLHERWDGVAPPPWFRSGGIVGQAEFPPPRRLRGPTGPPERVVLRRTHSPR